MFRNQRWAAVALSAAAVAALSACGSPNPYGANNYPGPAPTSSNTSSAPNYAEYGRVSSIEQVQAATQGSGVGGAVIGGVAGAVVGNQAGRHYNDGKNREAATVLGGAAGAALGNVVGRNRSASDAVYRVTVRTDNGGWRSYDLSSTGDLRVGDRVRLENGQIFRG